MNSAEKKLFINQMINAGIQLMFGYETESGGALVYVDAEECLLILSDKLAASAKHHGVDKASYIAWLHDEKYVHCSAITKKGQPCRIPASAGVSPLEYSEAQKTSPHYCELAHFAGQ